ncbi:MAG: DUF4292 domain-containing protein [Lewinellaceae bacterium]|nr:DUF4292 domain-containing protein [Lewinella sp.]MCB9280315.1 DUF4292 domain-containing protein [Lewinellaceae bacterium]
MKTIRLFHAVLLPLGLLLILSTGCGSARKAADAGAVPADADVLMNRLLKNQVNAKWFSAKARIEFADDSQSASGTLNIKMRKDSLIWVSVKKFGFEVARALVTPDSVYVINRLNGEYMAKDLGFIQREYQLPANLNMIQALLLGNPVFIGSTANMTIDTTGGQIHLFNGAAGRPENHFWVGPAPNLLLERMSLRDNGQDRSLDMSLEDYKPANKANKDFPYLREAELFSRESGRVKVKLNFSDVDLAGPLEIKFEIPDRYKRID